MFTMRELSETIGITEQSIYRLLKTNNEFRKIADGNCELSGKKKLYDQPVLDWLIDYYKPTLTQKEAQQTENEALIAELRNIISFLEKQLEDRAEELRLAHEELRLSQLQMGESLITIRKMTELRLLEAPKKGLFERIFGKKNQITEG